MSQMRLIFWPAYLVIVFAAQAAAFSWTDLASAGYDYAAAGYDWAAEMLGYESCPYVEDSLSAINASLSKRILGQDNAIRTIINITQGWDMNRKAAMDQEPLVLIFTGDTGVGKTETSYWLGHALLARKIQRGHTRAYDGRGFLNLRGEHYSPNSQAGMIGVDEVQKRITLALVELLKMCKGRGVVVFDEVQKVMPGALDVFLPMIEKRGALSVFDTTKGKWERYSTENMVIIFTTDVGGPKIRTLMLKYGGREEIPADVMQNELHKVLNATWGGNIKKFVKGIVPFLPLGNEQMKSICKFALSTHGAKLRGKYWYDFVVDDAVVELLADSEFLYEMVSVQSIGNQDHSPYFYKSTLGARGLENGAAGPISKLKALIGKTLGGKYRLNEVLHVGVLEQTQAVLWGTGNKRLQIYIQWCIPQATMFIAADGTCAAHDANPEPKNFIPSQSEDQQEGFVPWMQITLATANNKSVCETLLIEEWDRI